MIWILWLAACAQDPIAPGQADHHDTDEPSIEDDADDSGLPTQDALYEELEAPRLLRRLSIDLRGTVPTFDELETVEADPAQVEVYRDAWLYDEAIAERLVPLLGEHWATLSDEMPASYYEYGFELDDLYTWKRSIGQEPLRLMAHVVTEDLPWTEILTADYSMANEYLGPHWPMDGYPEGGTGWHQVQYNDGRPAVGVLATNGLWWRYGTSTFNQGRRRAEAITRLLICTDLLQRPVSFAFTDDLDSLTGTVDMVRSDPSCLACHAVVEPLSAAMYGFWPALQSGASEQERYHKERETMGPEELMVEPAWYGQPLSGLSELGHAIADDPRFTRCSAQTFAQLYLRRRIQLEDTNLITQLDEDFHAADLRVRPLIAAITDLPEYRAKAVVGDDELALERAVTTHAMTPSLLDTVVGGLMGFRWIVDRITYFDDDVVGYRSLAGGADGIRVTDMRPEPTLTSVLATQRLVQAAVEHASNNAWHADSPSGPFVDLPMDPDEDTLRDALDDTHFWLLARRASAEEIDDLEELWHTLHALGDDDHHGAELAWEGVWTVLLRDPQFVSY